VLWCWQRQSSLLHALVSLREQLQPKCRDLVITPPEPQGEEQLLQPDHELIEQPSGFGSSQHGGEVVSVKSITTHKAKNMLSVSFVLMMYVSYSPGISVIAIISFLSFLVIKLCLKRFLLL